MLGTIHRLNFGVTVIITATVRNGYTGVVINTVDRRFPVGDTLAISYDDFGKAQTVDLTTATIDMLLYHVARNGERELIPA